MRMHTATVLIAPSDSNKRRARRVRRRVLKVY
jgi:hypothetical protein